MMTSLNQYDLGPGPADPTIHGGFPYPLRFGTRPTPAALAREAQQHQQGCPRAPTRLPLTHPVMMKMKKSRKNE